MRVAGVDVGKEDDYTAVVVIDDLKIMGAWRIATGQSWDSILGAVVQKVSGCRLVAADSTGMGSMFASELGKHLPVIPFTFTAISKPVLIRLLVEGVSSGLSMNPGAEGADDLKEELLRFQCEPTRLGWKFSGKADGKKDDMVMALALALLARNRADDRGLLSQ